jgi:hypothetical protein
MTTFGQFALEMDKLVGKLDDRANERSKTAAKLLLRELVYATPVDTSDALSNWQIGLGQRPAARRGPFYAGFKGSTRESSAAAAIAVGMKRIEAKKPGEVLYLSNLIPYIVDLNRGSSAQAPAGFVEAAIMLTRNRIKANPR